LTTEEARHLEAFLTPSHIVVVATIGPSGMPQLTPNWYDYANGTLMISTTKERVKYRNLIRDNRMSVCIYSAPLAQEYTTLWGRVRIRDDESIWPDTRAIVERYVPPTGVEARMQQLRTQNRVIIDFTPERVLFRSVVLS
jgi:PPOX class probable F420-dependent enzyme